MTEQDQIRSDTGPFAMLPEWVLDADISDRAVRLYTILALHADRNDGTSFPRRRTLARRLSCSVDSVDRAVKELLGIRALQREHRMEDPAGDRRQTSNLWTVARVRHPGRTGAAGGVGSDAAPPGRTDAAPETITTKEPEPEELDLAPTAREYDPLKGTKINGRNLPWDALVEVTQADQAVEKGKLAKALKLIRGYVVETHAEQAFADERGEQLIASQIRARARLYRSRWPTIELTPTALANNWSRVTAPSPGGDLDSALEAAQRGIDNARRTA
jgi:Helix-turn-helix domain